MKNKTYTLCRAMDTWLSDSCVNEDGRSNYIAQMTVVRGKHAGLKYFQGISAYVPKQSNILLNYCPWCRESVSNFDAEGLLVVNSEEAKPCQK